MNQIIKKTLEEISLEYQKNFEMILKSIGTPKHDIYIKKERELHRKQIQAMKAAGTYVSDPCPLKSYIPCSSCTGYYRKEKSGTKIILSQCEKEDIDAIKCNLKKDNENLMELLSKLFIHK
jgi:hypothetical protein